MGAAGKGLIAVILLGLSAAPAPAQAAERAWTVTGFDRIAVGGDYVVTVAVGSGQGVRATGAQRDLDRLDVRVSGGQLRIRTRERHQMERVDGSPVHIRITVPSLRGAALAGNGSMEIDRVKGERFFADVAGTGAMRVHALQAEEVRIAVAGSGSVTAAGRCRDANLSIAGSGEAHLTGLACQSLSARVAGSGDVEANASRTAKLTLLGAGSVRVTGGAKCDVSRLGSGKVDCGS